MSERHTAATAYDLDMSSDPSLHLADASFDEAIEFSLKDVSLGVAFPWYCLASINLLVRYYENVLCRLSSICLLTYWYGWVATAGPSQTQLYNVILHELFRLPFLSGGETDSLGVHWTLNIARDLISTAISSLHIYVFGDMSWTAVALHTIIGLLVLHNSVFHLFMQKQMTRIIRLNQTVLSWRDFGLEIFWHTVIYRLISAMARMQVYVWWKMCHRACLNFFPEVMNKTWNVLSILVVVDVAFCRYLSIDAWSRALYCYMIYYVWLRELVQFSNPDPPMYKYSKLGNTDHIRLILLHPRFGFRPVSCSIIQGPCMQLLLYEAISYTWGTNPDRTEEILVNGCRMKVTQSAYEVLATFSSQFLPRALWIDAICIDQDNKEEKAQQVPMMDKIYSNALLTTIFLGQTCLPEASHKVKKEWLRYRFDSIRPQDERTRQHFESARFTFNLFNEFRVLEEPIDSLGKDIFEDYEFLSAAGSKAPEWSALLTLLQHPWFARVWVVQELALSPHVKVRYGDEVIDWEIMANAMTRIYSLRHFRLWLEWAHDVHIRHTDPTLGNIMRMNSLRKHRWSTERYSREKDINMTNILSHSLYFKAADPRDQVYGLMSLCTKKAPVRLKVDYKASVASVYLAAAGELVRGKAYGLLFGTAGIGNRSETGLIASNLPSWVPDWTDAPNYPYIKPTGGVRSSKSTFSWESEKVPPSRPSIFITGGRALTMSAQFVDTIESVGPGLFIPTSGEQVDSVTDEICALWTRYNSCLDFLTASPLVSDPYAHATPQQESLLGAFHRTLVTDHDVPVSTWAGDLSKFRSRPSSSTSADRKNIYANLQSLDDSTEKIESYCGRRRLFVSCHGRIGLCPPGTRKGDQVWAVPETKVPVLLRKIAAERYQRYKLVGECYCHGLASEPPSTGGAQTIVLL